MDGKQRAFLSEVASVGSMTIAPNSPKLALATRLLDSGLLQKKGLDEASGPTFMLTEAGREALGD